MAKFSVKVTFGETSKGNPTVWHEKYEFVKHREYANGTIQWRCKHYQKHRCQARLTTNGDIIVSNVNPDHDHLNNKKSTSSNRIAGASVISKKMAKSSAQPTSEVIRSIPVCTRLFPGVYLSLPKKMSDKALVRKHHLLQATSHLNTQPASVTEATSFAMTSHDDLIADRKVTFGETSRGNILVMHKQHEFLKHRENNNGAIQWRCKQYQKTQCQAHLMTYGDIIVGNHDPDHNHGNTCNKESSWSIIEMSKIKETDDDLLTADVQPEKVTLSSGDLTQPETKPSHNTALQSPQLHLQTTHQSPQRDIILSTPKHDGVDILADKKVTFGATSKGKPSVIYKHFEFVKHREYANGSIQWRCKRYQKSQCRARLTTLADVMISNDYPDHNHASNEESALARLAVNQMKKKMIDSSATSTTVINSVSTQLPSSVLMALPKSPSLRKTLQRQRQRIQSALKELP